MSIDVIAERSCSSESSGRELDGSREEEDAVLLLSCIYLVFLFLDGQDLAGSPRGVYKDSKTRPSGSCVTNFPHGPRPRVQ